MLTFKKLGLQVLALCTLLSANAQTRFTTEQLNDRKFVSTLFQNLPRVIEWKNDNQFVIQQTSAPGTKPAFYLYDVKKKSATPMPATYSVPKGTVPEATVQIKGNDVVITTALGERKLTNTTEEEVNPELSPDNRFVAFTRNNDLYTVEVASGKETRLTNDGSQLILNGYATWVYWEEIFGRGTNFRAFWWSPNSNRLAFMRFDQGKIPMFPLYVADGSHGYIEETRYPKAGDPNPEVQLGFVSPEGGAVTWADFNKNNDHQLGWPEWKPDGSALYVQWQNRKQDSLVMYAVNPTTAGLQSVYQEYQPTWINLDEADERLTFIKGGAEMLIRSDKNGWKQLYRYSSDGRFLNRVTNGDYTVVDVLQIDDKAGKVYFIARGVTNSLHRQLCMASLDGKQFKVLTPTGFNLGRTVSISPTGKNVVGDLSNINTPSRLAVMNANGQELAAVAQSATGVLAQYQQAKTEIRRIKSADGKYDLPVLITWPYDYSPNKKYPVLIDVYGGPDATTVMDSWRFNVQREKYAQQGLLQLSFDNRASGHFGKKGIDEIHRQLGIKEIEDFMHLAKHFIDAGVVDPERVCISGFSFGGYMSCMALTYGSSVFTHGMAGGSVTDWRLYDSHYTERYMDTPQENPEGYKATSAMTYADRYKGLLQIVHGTMDDNVHMQNSLQLVGALQDKGKTFELMLYPNGRHGWRFLPARDAHYNNLREQFIQKNLLRK